MSPRLFSFVLLLLSPLAWAAETGSGAVPPAPTLQSTAPDLGSSALQMVFGLIVVLALLLYTLSARPPATPPGWFDRLQLLMVVAALVMVIPRSRSRSM